MAKTPAEEQLAIAIEALQIIRSGSPELDDWGDYNPQRLARDALRRIDKIKKNNMPA